MPQNTAAELVVSAGVEPNSEHLAVADDYLARARRSRWFGLACGLVAGIGPLAGEEDHSLVVPRLLAGYLFGVLLSELFPPRAARGSVRVASLRPRLVRDLVPPFALVLPWLVLLPVLAAPLLALGSHPRGVTRFKSAQADCFGRAYWPRTSTLIGIAALAALGLILLVLALRRAARRPQQVDDPSTLQLDRALRGRSARAAVASASAMGLTLLGLIGQYLYDGIHSFDCTRPFIGNTSVTGNVYSWGDAVSPWLQDVSLALMILAIPVWMICRRLPLPSHESPDA